MVVHKRMLVLANSVKKGSGRCIAGHEIIAAGKDQSHIGPWLRPVTSHGEVEDTAVVNGGGPRGNVGRRNLLVRMVAP